eukprot:PhM_4_TR12372/c0_g1_i1/m.14008/K14589/CMTR1, FTSJD2, MTR1; cap1 methyltransferase
MTNFNNQGVATKRNRDEAQLENNNSTTAVSVDEMFWLPSMPQPSATATTAVCASSWHDITIENYFKLAAAIELAPSALVKDVYEKKCALGCIDTRRYLAIRNRLFPECTSGSNKYANRAGDKLEAVLEVSGIARQLKEMKCATPDGSSFTFADVCGGPGAFSEMLFVWACETGGLTRASQQVRGYGLTLMDKHKGAPHGWYPKLLSANDFFVSFGVDGTGDIYKAENVAHFVSMVQEKEESHGGGVDIVVADGGFDLNTSNLEDLQELFSATLLLAECVAAISVLKHGGKFVLKAFDTLSPFMASVLLQLAYVFEQVGICKPHRSRVMNSERYIVARGFKASTTQEKEVVTRLISTWQGILKMHSDAKKQRDASASLLPQYLDHALVECCTPFSLSSSSSLNEETQNFLAELRSATTILMEKQQSALHAVLSEAAK